MRDHLLGPRRGEWVAYLRARHHRDRLRSQEGGRDYDNGICHGIIPFGAITAW